MCVCSSRICINDTRAAEAAARPAEMLRCWCSQSVAPPPLVPLANPAKLVETFFIFIAKFSSHPPPSDNSTLPPCSPPSAARSPFSFYTRGIKTLPWCRLLLLLLVLILALAPRSTFLRHTHTQPCQPTPTAIVRRNQPVSAPTRVFQLFQSFLSSERETTTEGSGRRATVLRAIRCGCAHCAINCYSPMHHANAFHQ